MSSPRAKALFSAGKFHAILSNAFIPCDLTGFNYLWGNTHHSVCFISLFHLFYNIYPSPFPHYFHLCIHFLCDLRVFLQFVFYISKLQICLLWHPMYSLYVFSLGVSFITHASYLGFFSSRTLLVQQRQFLIGT